MSLYNLLFGMNPSASVLLKMLNLTEEDIGRFRDAYMQDGKIVIYTRNGGGNRGHWDFVYDKNAEGADCPCPGCKMDYVLSAHPNYVRDYDDDFDSTYAYVVFDVPEKYREFVTTLTGSQAQEVQTVCEKFQTLIKELGGKVNYG